MGLMKELAAVLFAAGLLLAIPAGRAAAAYPDGVTAAASRMQELGLIQGRDPEHPEELALNQHITRAELVTVIVRAFGMQEAAGRLKGVPAFPDSGSHWASGEIAMAKTLIEQNGFSLGMPDGSFRPDAPVSTSQAVAFMVKFLGIRFDEKGIWPDQFYQAAVASGLLTPDDKSRLLPLAEQSATRGVVFYIMDSGFSNVKLPGSTKTVYSKHVKPDPPILSVNPVPASSTGRVTVTGYASRDVRDLFVNGVRATRGDQNRFTATVEVAEGDGIAVRAVDIVGNVVTKMARMGSSTAPSNTVIDAPAALTLRVGESADLPIAIRDRQGNLLSDVPFSVSTEMGRVSGGKFTAGTRAGTGIIMVICGEQSQSVAVTVLPGEPARLEISPPTALIATAATQKFSVAAYDTFGNPVTVADGVKWTASRGLISDDGVYFGANGVNGLVTVTATLGAISATAQATVFGQATHIELNPPTALVADGISRAPVVATIRDAYGSLVSNYQGRVRFLITGSTDASLSMATAPVVEGIAQVDVVAGIEPGEVSIIATTDELTSGAAEMEVAPQVPTSLALITDPSPLSADGVSTMAATVVPLDQNGNPIRSDLPGTWLATVTSSNTRFIGPAEVTEVALTYNAVEEQVQGTAEFQSTHLVGASTITAALFHDGAETGIESSQEVQTVPVGPPAMLAIDPIKPAYASGPKGTVQRVVVRVLDANGHQVTGAGTDPKSRYVIHDLMLTANTGTKALLPPVSGLSNAGSWSGGKAVIAVTDTRAELVAYSASATFDQDALKGADAAGLFRAGPAADIILAAEPDVLQVNSGISGGLTARIVDQHGNHVPEGSFEVSFRRTGPEPWAVMNWRNTTVDSAGGFASVPLTPAESNGADTFEADLLLPNGTKVTSNSVLVTTAGLGLARQLRWGPLSPVTAGETVQIDVRIYDGKGSTIVTYDNSSTVKLNVTDPSRGSKTYEATAINGVATFHLQPLKSGNYTLKATSPGMKGASTPADNGSATLVVNAARPATVKAVASPTTIAANNQTTTTVTVSLLDAFGNPAVSDASFNLDGLQITTSNSAVANQTGDITFFRADGKTPTNVPEEKSVAKVSIKAGSTVGIAIISARKSGLTPGTVTINTTFGGSIARRAILVPDGPTLVTTDIADRQFQKVTVTLLDAAGNRVTDPNVPIYARLTWTGSPSIRVFLDDGPDPTPYDERNRPRLDADNGGEVTFFVTNMQAEEVQYRVDLMTNASGDLQVAGLTGDTAVGTFAPGTPYQIALTSKPKVMKGNGSSKTTVTAILQDQNGNTVVDAEGSLQLRIEDGSGTVPASILGADEEGIFTAALTAGQSTFTVQSKLSMETVDVYIEASYWGPDDTAPAVVQAPRYTLSVGSNADNTVPTVIDLAIVRSTNGAVRTGDKFIVTFSERTNAPELTEKDFSLPTGKAMGDSTYTWDESGMVLTITVGPTAVLENGDAIKLAGRDTITDLSGNGFGTGNLLVLDLMSPLATVSVTRNIAGLISMGDIFVISFNEPVKAGNLSNASFSITGGHHFGEGASFTWDVSQTLLTITVGSDPTLAHGDSLAFAGANVITDRVGNPIGTKVFYQVDLNKVMVAKTQVYRAKNLEFNANDTITVTFSRPTNAPKLVPQDFVISNGHTFGVGATFTWDDTRTALTIKAGTLPTLKHGDSVRLAQGAKIMDAGGNNLGTAPLFTADLQSPYLTSVVMNRANNRSFQAGDTLVLTFNEPTSGQTINVNSFKVSGGHGFGTGASFLWNEERTVLTITAGNSPSLLDDDTVAFASASVIRDLSGNAFGNEVFLFVDLTSPVVIEAQVSRAVNHVLSEGDTISLTFSEMTNVPILSVDDFIISGGHSFGENPEFRWSEDHTVLTIVGGSSSTLQTGDTIALKTPRTIADAAGNGYGAGALWTVDLSAPAIRSVAVRRAVDNAFAAGDTITITFNKMTTAPDLAATDFAISGGRDFGQGASFRWDISRQVLTITGAGKPTLQPGDSVAFATAGVLRDMLGNSVGTEPLFTVDLTAPAVVDVQVLPAGGSGNGTVEAGDQIALTLSEPIADPPALSAADFGISRAGSSLGADAAVAWSDGGTKILITLGEGALLQEGDVLSLLPSAGATIKDEVGNPVGGVDFYTVVLTDF